MLSATTSLWSPLALPADPIAMEASLPAQQASPALSLTELTQGGYLPVGFSNVLDADIREFTIVPAGTADGFDSTAVLNNSTHDFIQFDYLLRSQPFNTNIEAIRFVSPLQGPLAKLPSATVPSEIAVKKAETVEGGTIFIESLLPDGGLLAEGSAKSALPSIASGHESERRMAKDLSNGSHRSQFAISSESARAMVFEMAGGEPTDHNGGLRDGRRAWIPKPGASGSQAAGFPVSSVEVSNGEVHTTATADGEASVRMIPGGHTVHASVHANRTNVERRDSWKQVEQIGDHRLDFQRATASTIVYPSDENPDSTLASPLDPVDASYALAFEQFHIEKSITAPAMAGENALQRSLAVTPLLVVWALERIAASSSRRAAAKPAGVPHQAPLCALNFAASDDQPS